MTYDPWAAIREEPAEPVRLLQEMGLTDGIPNWWREAVTPVDQPGTYILNPKFLGPYDIRQLAALTLEGYYIKTFPRRDYIRVLLTKDRQ